uniref:Plastid lipid-associated protein/fibrillin conserved domain-containing protein n=1 Tax=Fibrocapsa japonica TaxID=94617 RepID=A0A7S2Y3H7_9STRA
MAVLRRTYFLILCAIITHEFTCFHHIPSFKAAQDPVRFSSFSLESTTSAGQTKDIVKDEVESVASTMELVKEAMAADSLTKEEAKIEKSHDKQGLIDMMPITPGDIKSRIEVDRLCQSLETGFVPSHTTGFLQFAMQGRWRLGYSSFPVRDPSASVVVDTIHQVVDPGPTDQQDNHNQDQQHPESIGENPSPASLPSNLGVRTGKITNVINWRELGEPKEEGAPREELSKGVLEVVSKYTINNRGQIDVSLLDHFLKPKTMPKDPEALVNGLMKTMPFEMFDPNDSTFQITYMDPDVKIIQLVDSRLAGVKNIFYKETPCDMVNNENY